MSGQGKSTPVYLGGACVVQLYFPSNEGEVLDRDMTELPMPTGHAPPKLYWGFSLGALTAPTAIAESLHGLP